MSNINDPNFFSDGVLNERAEPAQWRDFAPGPNESADRARNSSYSVRQALAQGAVPSYEPPQYEAPQYAAPETAGPAAPIVPVEPAVDRSPPVGSQTDAKIDALADTVAQLANVVAKMNQGE